MITIGVLKLGIPESREILICRSLLLLTLQEVGKSLTTLVAFSADASVSRMPQRHDPVLAGAASDCMIRHKWFDGARGNLSK